MSESSENELDFKRYTPQHPLPDKIREMARDETVCQYCGVSYLIHSEIKALEKKLETAEKELIVLRGCDEREKKLKKSLGDLEKKNRELKSTQEDIQKENKGLALKLKTSEESCLRLKDENANLKKTEETQRLKWTNVKTSLSDMSSSVTLQKSSVKQLKLEMKSQDKVRVEELNSMRDHIITQLKEEFKAKQELLSRVKHYEEENMMLKKSNQVADDILKSQVSEMEKVVKLRDEVTRQDEVHTQLQQTISRLEERLHEHENHSKILKSDVDLQRTSNRKLTMEMEQLQHQIKTKAKDLDNLTGQISKKDHQHEVALNNIMVQLKAKDGELEVTKKELTILENLYQDQIQKEQVINSQTKATLSETREIKEALRRARGDLEALKNERELMIEAHHTRIEELRESFKKKMAETEHWPEKLAESLQAEKSKQMEEMFALENKLKQDFVSSLQVEKEKYDLLMKKYQDKLKDQDSDAKSQLQKQIHSLQSSHQAEVSMLRQQMADSQARMADNDRDLRKEIQSLKKIIADLENRIGYLNEGSVDETSKLKRELLLTKEKLAEIRIVLSNTEGKLKQTKEEVVFLQETVHKECEERFELTEALSQVKKELLQLKRPAGGYGSGCSQRTYTASDSGGNLSLSARSHNSIVDDSRPKNIEFTPSNQNVAYQGESAKSLGTLKGNSVAENRKRIAEILGKPS